jgi:hypothetical protein
MNPEFARRILALAFSEALHQRMAVLSQGAQAGSLKPDEQKELESDIEASHLLALIQSESPPRARGLPPDGD